jgi:hypothetical protein
MPTSVELLPTGDRERVMMPRTQHTLIAFAVFAITAPTFISAQQADEQLQGRYRLCMNKADTDFQEEFRGNCDVLCIHQQHGSESSCLAQHMKWNTASCTLPAAEENRQEQHLEKAKTAVSRSSRRASQRRPSATYRNGMLRGQQTDSGFRRPPCLPQTLPFVSTTGADSTIAWT